ncbi:NUDIX domain-containing protein [Larsenimonas rhizosphaerae]|uniref:NUDIX hydrolase n=1 Tax=Larsenimonas rhizosphaerae TaxID=2944682 RepID=A0AA42CUR3_9GAMM|nr:NUDIX hydrolase [Larsenimonas rhizosphaerae]MCX2524659.1 NUDIX hydrolase [Larsenimonas rhizosphaerae]
MRRWTPHTTVATVIQHEHAFLLVEERQGPGPTVFNQPAGHLEQGETLFDAARRETREESGCTVALDGYLGLYVHTSSAGVTYHSHSFLAHVTGHVDAPLDTPIVAAHWLTPDAIKALSIDGRLRSPLVLRRVQDALAGRRFPLELVVEG